MARLRSTLLATGVAIGFAAPLPALAINVLQSYVTSITVSGSPGVLRPASGWDPAPAATPASTIFDGVFRPENTVWTNGTFWWDEWAFGAASNPVSIEVQLAGTFTLDRFVVQADNNENYHVEWWDGAAWQAAYTAGAIAGFGMMTRDSGDLAGIMTDRLRLTATGGDAFYSLSEVQAYGVPLPGTLALVGLAGAGLFVTRRRRVDAAQST